MAVRPVPPPSARLRLIALFVGVVVVPLILIALLEASSSFILLSLAFRRSYQGREFPLFRRHAQYDAELGWVSVPNTSIPNMYGRDVGLRIDSQGFRETPNPSSPARLRVVCSGDSFTFGEGVADDRTWCARLAAMDSGLATVNMGQTGYGVDQAYLWYKRDGRQLEHEIHLFTYITNDFRRMQLSSFSGYAKPVLAIQNDSLLLKNTPVPRSKTRSSWYSAALVVRQELRIAQLFLWVRDSVFHGHGIQRGSLSGDWTEEDSLTWVKVRRITGDLARINRMRGRTLILVHLPVIEDYWSRESDPWRNRAQAVSGEGEFVFVDLVRELRKLPADSVDQMFIGHGDARGHYSVVGNEWVAKQVYRRLLEIPAATAKLGRLRPPPTSAEKLR